MRYYAHISMPKNLHILTLYFTLMPHGINQLFPIENLCDNFSTILQKTVCLQ